MKVEQFFYALEIADTGSFSQAARNLYISPPNLSYAVKQIEKTVGFPLFVRTPVGVVPTPEGSKLIERFRIIKREYDQIDEIISSQSHPSQLALRVGTMDLDRFTPVFTQLIQQYVGQSVNFSFLNYDNLNQIMPLVERCQLDFSVIGTLSPYLETVMANLSNHSIAYNMIADVPICALAGPMSPLYHREASISLEELYPYTIVSRGNVADDPELSLLHTTGLSAHVFSEIHVNSSHFFYNMIQTTPVVGLAAYTPLAFQSQSMIENVHAIPISDCDVTAQFGWIKHYRLPLSETASWLLDEIVRLF